MTELSLANQVDQAWNYVDMADQATDDGDYEKADDLIDRALKMDPNNAKAHLEGVYFETSRGESDQTGRTKRSC